MEALKIKAYSDFISIFLKQFSTLYTRRRRGRTAKRTAKRKAKRRRSVINCTRKKRRRGAFQFAQHDILNMEAAKTSEVNTQRTARTKGRKEKEMKNTAKKEAQKEAATKDAKKAKTTKGRKEEDMKKNTQKKEAAACFDINAHNNKMIIEHADGSRTEATAEEVAKRSLERYKAEKVAQLRKWAKARGIEGADSMKKAALVAALVAHDAMPKEEKPKAKKARKEAAAKKEAEAQKEAKEKKEEKPKAKKDAAKKEKKEKKEAAAAVEKMDSVKTSLEKEDARIAIAMDVQNMQNAEIADALNRIKALKLYEVKNADSMKNFVEEKCRTAEDIEKGRKGKYRGMSYSTCNMYINAHNYVYSMKDADGHILFEAYGMHLIQALVTPCRYFAEGVRAAVEEGEISASMSLEALKKLIDAKMWKKAKKEAAPKEAAEGEEEGEEAEAEEMPKTEKHNGISTEAAEAAAAVLSVFIDSAKAKKKEKEAAQKALETLMKRADI